MSQISDNIRKAESDALDQIERFIGRVVEKIRRDAVLTLKSDNGIASGNLRKAIVTDVMRNLGKIIGIVGVAADVPYGIYKHEGTRPHFPPLEPIQKWVRIKRLGGRYSMKTRGRLGTRAKQDVEDSAIARAIVRKIGREGTKGLPFLRLAMNQNIGWIEAEAAKVQI